MRGVPRVATVIAATFAHAVLASAPALADEADEQQEAVATLTLATTALRLGEAEVVVLLMDGTVSFDLADNACGKAYRKPGKAAGRARLALARCLVELGRAASPPGRPWRVKGQLRLDAVLAGQNYVFDLRRVKGRLRIASIARATPVMTDPFVPAHLRGGVDGGEEEGTVAGVIGGIEMEAPPPPPPPPPPPSPPQHMVPQAFEHQRISGEKNILPDDATKDEIAASGRTQFIVPVKVCVGTSGAVTDVRVLKSSGFPAYDAKLTREIRTWRYKPFIVNGRPAPACSMVNFSYRQDAAPPPRRTP